MDDGSDRERRFFETLGARRRIRIAVRAIIVFNDHILLQRIVMPHSYLFFPGGEVEFGEALEDALRRELAEETTLDVKTAVYRFTANNRFTRNGTEFHLLEHYFEVTPGSFEVASREAGFALEWIPLDQISSFDVRPFGVRDVLGISGWRSMRLLEVE